MEAIGTARDYSELQALLRQRAADLGLTREAIDDLVGLQNGYASKLLAPEPIKRLGAQTIGPFLEGLGLKLVVTVDELALEKHAGRIARSQAEKPFRPDPPIPSDVKIAAKHLIRQERAAAGRKGAAALNARLTPEERSARARKAARARWGNGPSDKLSTQSR